MRKIERTSQFKRDYKRESRGRHQAILLNDFREILQALANDEVLLQKHRDHALTGEWNDHRDCHIRPDLVLIYRKPNSETLQLVRLGSHSQRGL